MTTTLNGDGRIEIPDQLRSDDQLHPGDAFEVHRLAPGRYLLAKHALAEPRKYSVEVDADGLPVIRASGVITAELVKEIEASAW